MVKFDPPLDRCDLCESTDISPFYKDYNGISIFICGNCGIQFMNPQYTSEFLKDFYSRYTPDAKPRDERRLTGNWNYCMDLFERHLPGKGSFLDIGCGYGHSLRTAKERSWDAVGYEIDPELAGRVEKAVGARVVSGDFAQFLKQPKSCDLVSMSHVIEHLKSPVSYLKTIRAVLKDGGLLFIAMPNIRSFSSRGKYILEKLRLKTRHVGRYYDTGHHLFYFAPGTISRFLRANGFTLLAMRNCDFDGTGRSRPFRYLRDKILGGWMWKSTFYVLAAKRDDPIRRPAG